MIPYAKQTSRHPYSVLRSNSSETVSYPLTSPTIHKPTIRGSSTLGGPPTIELAAPKVTPHRTFTAFLARPDRCTASNRPRPLSTPRPLLRIPSRGNLRDMQTSASTEPVYTTIHAILLPRDLLFVRASEDFGISITIKDSTPREYFSGSKKNSNTLARHYITTQSRVAHPVPWTQVCLTRRA